MDTIKDTTSDILKSIAKDKTHSDAALLKELKKRKLIVMQKNISYNVSKGPKFALEVQKEFTDLDADMIARSCHWYPFACSC